MSPFKRSKKKIAKPEIKEAEKKSVSSLKEPVKQEPAQKAPKSDFGQFLDEYRQSHKLSGNYLIAAAYKTIPLFILMIDLALQEHPDLGPKFEAMIKNKV